MSFPYCYHMKYSGPIPLLIYIALPTVVFERSKIDRLKEALKEIDGAVVTVTPMFKGESELAQEHAALYEALKNVVRYQNELTEEDFNHFRQLIKKLRANNDHRNPIRLFRTHAPPLRE